jgi:hypothetical protein
VEAGPAGDQYALGVVLYEALAGAPPYAAPTVDATLRAADRGVHVPLAELAPDAPDAVVAAIERAIRRTPADRFPTVRDLASHLEEARTSLPADVPSATDAPRATDAPSATGPSAAGPSPVTGSAAAGERSPSAPPLPTHRGGGTTDRPAPARRGGADDPSATRRFGPAPPRATPDAAPTRRRVPLLLAALAVALVPGGVVLALVLGGDDGPTITATPADGDDPGGPADVEALPPCDDAPALPPGAGDPVPADTTGSGCTVDLGWDPDGPILAVPQEDGGELVRYQLGEPGDVLVVGDWDCDGRQTPGLYRPDSGEVFLFDGFAGAGGELDSRPGETTGVTGGTPVVTTDDDGCDRIEVREDA